MISLDHSLPCGFTCSSGKYTYLRILLSKQYNIHLYYINYWRNMEILAFVKLNTDNHIILQLTSELWQSLCWWILLLMFSKLFAQSRNQTTIIPYNLEYHLNGKQIKQYFSKCHKRIINFESTSNNRNHS